MKTPVFSFSSIKYSSIKHLSINNQIQFRYNRTRLLQTASGEILKVNKIDHNHISTLFPTHIGKYVDWSKYSKFDGSFNIIPLILHQDDDILVVYKPPTLLIQPGKDDGEDDSDVKSTVNSEEPNLFDLCSAYSNKTYSDKMYQNSICGLIHRLDRPSSGIVVISKNLRSTKILNDIFKKRNVIKKYLCVVNGDLQGKGTCHHLLSKSSSSKIQAFDIKPPTLPLPPTDKKQIKTVEAKLSYQNLLSISYNSKANPSIKKHQSLIKVELETGRKHQIRAQLSKIGHPICGDVKYGASQTFKTKDIALHAYFLSFPHPTTNKQMSFECNIPSAWENRFGIETVKKVNSLIKNPMFK
eukprot:gene7987-10830_t